MDDPRPCAVCDAPIPYKSVNYKTCGHPRCVRTYRARAQKRRDDRKRVISWVAPDNMAPDTRGRMRVVDAWDMLAGLPEWQRIPETAQRAGETVAVTLSVLRAEGRVR